MIRAARLLLFVFAFVLASCTPAPPAPAPPTPHPRIAAPTLAASSAPVTDVAPKAPVARREPRVLQIHGRQLVDDYAWLRNKGTPEVESYLAAENEYTRAKSASFEPLAQSLYDEMLARLKEDDSTPPIREGAYRYYQRFEKGKSYPIHCRVAVVPARFRDEKRDGPEEILLDVNALGAGEKFIDVTGLRVSRDAHRLVYLVDTRGFRQYTLQIKDLGTGALLSEAMPRVAGAELANDDKTLFYVTEDAQTKRANKLFRHVIGEDASRDVLVYEEADPMFDLWLRRTLSRAFLVLTSASHTTSEVRLIDAAHPDAPPRVVALREHGHEYYVDHRGDLLYIRTNSGGRNFRLVTAPASDPRRDRWKEVIPHRTDVMLEHILAFRDRLILLERKDAVPMLSVFDYKTAIARPIAQPEATYDVEFDTNREFGASAFRFRYQSHKTPPSIVEHDFVTSERRVLKETPVIGYDAAAYETKRITAPARDGTPIPISLVFRKGTQPDGSHPLLLNGYGSYGISLPLSFSSERVSLLDRGFIFALAHIRGGGDNGKAWHDGGRMASKMNTFTDFIDVADALKKQGWAKQDALVASGRSAGGLLMGAIANMRPEMFRIVLAYVPFVDVINTMRDESLPLTVTEFEEWGNPKNETELDAISKYSPYDNVEAKAYPTMLVRTSYNDSQVMYWEPAKWVAKLRAKKTDAHDLLFKINMEPAGHTGQSGRYDRMRDTAWDYAFVIANLEPTRAIPR